MITVRTINSPEIVAPPMMYFQTVHLLSPQCHKAVCPYMALRNLCHFKNVSWPDPFLDGLLSP